MELFSVPYQVRDDEENTQKHLICRGLQGFQLTYFDRDGNEAEEWQVDELVPGGDSDEQMEFPALVSIELKFADSMESDSSSVFKTAVALP